ncbi:MAG: TIGR03013 family PEP-CTERM/XrtA system glycosyltransferase, partial [Gammaproteobacteria bacterium]|nr:TIGR03013 family PEP-CTERM/XrtA system glycosyltransferase [Gammaproteobacteria bacterium]
MAFIRVLGKPLRLSLLLLIVAEAAVFVLAPHVVTWLGLGSFGAAVGTDSSAVWPGSAVFAVFALLAFFAVGLYANSQRANFGGIAIRVFVGVFAAVMLSALVYYFVPSIGIGRRTLAVAAAIAALVSLLLRQLLERLFEDDLFKRRVLVLGAGRRAATLLQLRRRTDTRAFNLIGFMPASGDEIAVPAARLLPRAADLSDWCLQHEIDEVVLAMDDRRRDFPTEELLECRLSGIDVLELVAFFERETGKVRLDVSSPSWIVLGEGFRDSAFHQFAERGFDLLVSTVLLIASVPVLLLTALAIKLEDGWRAPVLYRQLRVGRYNRPFEILKFRSMREDAEAAGAVWAQRDDPRVTRVGRVIRKLRIDELPQLWNVFRGDMSFVGPRPERPEFVDRLAQKLPFYRSRHAVKPGITG